MSHPDVQLPGRFTPQQAADLAEIQQRIFFYGWCIDHRRFDDLGLKPRASLHVRLERHRFRCFSGKPQDRRGGSGNDLDRDLFGGGSGGALSGERSYARRGRDEKEDVREMSKRTLHGDVSFGDSCGDVRMALHC